MKIVCIVHGNKKETFYFPPFEQMEQPHSKQQNDKMSTKYLLDKYFLATFISLLCLTPHNNCGSVAWKFSRWMAAQNINRFWMRYFFYCFWILLHFWDNTRALYNAHWTHCAVHHGHQVFTEGPRESIGFLFCFCGVVLFCVRCVEFENVVHD